MSKIKHTNVVINNESEKLLCYHVPSIYKQDNKIHIFELKSVFNVDYQQYKETEEINLQLP